jgi:universal stress protein E
VLQLKSLLVALADLTSASSASIDEAVRISRGSGAQITLLHAVPVPVMPQFGDDLEGDRDRAEARCEELAARLRERGALVADLPIVRIESPAQLVMTAIAEQNRDLVVLGLGNKAAIDRILLGSTVERVLRECPRPVWLARPPQRPQLTRILAAVDTSPAAGDAMRMGLLLARTFQARLELLRVFPESESRARSLPQQKESLPAFARGFDTEGVTIEYLPWEGEPGVRIVEAAHARKCDLLVIGMAGRRGLMRWIKTNMAERVARELPCSLLSVPPQPVKPQGT